MFTALCVMSTFICSSWGGWKLPSTDAMQKACDSDSLGIKVPFNCVGVSVRNG